MYGGPREVLRTESELDLLAQEQFDKLCEAVTKSLVEKSRLSRADNQTDLKGFEVKFAIVPDIFLHMFSSVLDLGTISLDGMYVQPGYTFSLTFEAFDTLHEIYGCDPYWYMHTTDEGKIFKIVKSDLFPIHCCTTKKEVQKLNHEDCIRCKTIVSIAGNSLVIFLLNFPIDDRLSLINVNVNMHVSCFFQLIIISLISS